MGIQRQLCSGIPSSQTYSRPTELCSKYDVDPAVRAIIMCRTLGRRYETRRFSRVCEEQLGRKESVQSHSCSLYERLVKDDLNEKEATAIGDEATEVPVEDPIVKSETPILIANIIIFIGNCCLSLTLVSVTTLHLQ